MDRKVLITGTNRGIGLELVKKFAANHDEIIACARVDSEEFEVQMNQISKMYDTQISTYFFDLEDEDQIKLGIRKIISENKNIDVLINNAGIVHASSFLMYSSKEIKRLMEVNYIAPLIISQFVARNMMKNKGGSIINIASVSGIQNEPGRIGYGGSKAALIFASKTMSLELAEYGIRVNCISPGFIDTDMWRNRSDDLYMAVLSETPLGRQGTVQDIANVAYFLASDEASYITGQNIVVDGGRKN